MNLRRFGLKDKLRTTSPKKQAGFMRSNVFLPIMLVCVIILSFVSKSRPIF